MTMLWTTHRQQSPLSAETEAHGLRHLTKDRHDQTVLDPADIVVDKTTKGGADGAKKEVADRLMKAEQEAKEIAQAKAPLKPDAPSMVVGVGSSADGQDATLKQHESEDGTKSAAAGASVETEEEHEAEQELRSILKKAPGSSHFPWRSGAAG